MDDDSNAYNEIAPGAPLVRFPREPEFDPSPDDSPAKDRRPVIRYGRSTHRRGTRTTKGEAWLINSDGNREHDRYLLGSNRRRNTRRLLTSRRVSPPARAREAEVCRRSCRRILASSVR